MNSALAQVAAIAAHGTAWLRGDGSVPSDLATTNSTFQFIGETRFVGPSRRLRSSVEHDSVDAWLAWLREEGTDRIWVAVDDRQPPPGSLPHHIAAAFAGTAPFGLIVQAGAKASLWVPTWEVADQDAPDRRIWRVTFNAYEQPGYAPPTVDVAGASGFMRERLEAIHAFAVEHELGQWPAHFERALASGTGAAEPEHGADILPPVGYAEDARRLVAMGTIGWVFAGMGSWNDQSFPEPDQSTYMELSAGLYHACVVAAFIGVNAPFDA